MSRKTKNKMAHGYQETYNQTTCGQKGDPPNWDTHMKDPELDHIIIQAAADKDFCKTLT